MNNDEKNNMNNDEKDNMTDDEKKKCHAIIHTATVLAGLSSLIPIRCADAVPITGAQILMIIALGKVFEVNISKSIATAVTSGFAAIMAGRTAVSSILKFVPFLGQVANVSIAGGITEALGWATAYSFHSLTPAQRKKGIGPKELLDLIRNFFNPPPNK